jgi:hypothetical protein
MEEVRYNLSTKFYIKGDSLLVFSAEKQITLNFCQNIYDFFVFLEEKVIITNISNVAARF